MFRNMTKKNLKSKTLIKIYIIQTCRECFLKSLDFGIFPQFHDTSNYKMYYQCNNHFSGGGESGPFVKDYHHWQYILCL